MRLPGRLRIAWETTDTLRIDAEAGTQTRRFFFSGVQLISIGILGEYLGRIYQETKMRPTFVVKEVRGGREAPAAAQPARAAERSARAV